MPDIKVIFTHVGISRDVDKRVKEILEEMTNFSFEDNSFITSSDEMVADSIVRGLKKKTCKENEREKLIEMVNRGGLHKPSHIVHITCIHAWICTNTCTVTKIYSGR